MDCVYGEFRRLLLPGSRSGAKYPYIRARLIFRDRDYGLVSFLIDTGSGATLIGPGDALRLGINGLKGKPVKIVGIAAAEKDIRVNGRVVLEFISSSSDDTVLKVELDGLSYRQLPKKHGKEFQEQLRIPSLLGWDALSRLTLFIDYKNNIVRLCKTDTH